MKVRILGSALGVTPAPQYVSSYVVDDAIAIDGYTQHREKGGELRYSTLDFSGTLTVTAPDAFKVALRQGVGRAKAFGCGLLLIRPAA